jgi:hypothetical protein
MVKMDMVDIRAMRVRMMVLDFKVIRVAKRIPAFVAVKGPKENKGAPSVVKGSSNQRKRTKALTMRRRTTTLWMGSLARNVKERAIKRAGMRAGNRSDTATTIEKIPATNVLIRGSRRWMTDLPTMNPSSST